MIMMLIQVTIMSVCMFSLGAEKERRVSCDSHQTRIRPNLEPDQVPNISRYAQEPIGGTQVALSIERILESDGGDLAVDASNQYRINRDLGKDQQTTRTKYDLLDSEDVSLLDKFYRETRHQDPFQSETLTSQGLWDESNDKELADALVDLTKDVQQMKNKDPERVIKGDWTIDQQLIEQTKKLLLAHHGVSNHEQQPGRPRKLASYSPTIRLLTSYDPIEKAVHDAVDTNQVRGWRGNRVVGATLYSNNETMKPNVSSKSPSEAIKLHDELLEEPPHDGKVRVRMYFHRAIHDDVKLYGTGPWKYWGHGWGVEFGYDPKQKEKPDYYQKGYTIERAFGRDFCRDKRNCRPPDPKFYEVKPGVEVKPA